MNTDLLKSLLDRQVPVAVIGLGYVGLPLAVCLARVFRVIGFDTDGAKISRLRAGRDETGEICSADLLASGIELTTEAARLRDAGFVIVAVPTPVDQAKRPDFGPLIGASMTIGRNLKPGAVVVFESTVYPGATAEVCIPIIERESGSKAGTGFTYGYSPERINPGDREHTIEKIRKVVSGSDAATLEVVAGVYGAVITAGVYRAASVEVAEAAKVIENTQRDLNIALVNELALIFHRLGIDTLDVLEAAGTKWNFLPFRPGLVGGHCIGVDPYYLTHKAAEAGYHPEVILAGRRINDGMGHFVAQECVRLLIQAGSQVKGAHVLVLGITFKENCPDVRNTRVVDILSELKRFGAVPVVHDPVADAATTRHEYGIDLFKLQDVPKCAAVIAAVAHQQFRDMKPNDLAKLVDPQAPLIDVRCIFKRSEVLAAGLTLWRL
jgi:UDP-N-acetyl-D-glucosamine/UDP-N-acetyl-D-galactosamine dehydrogenase